jgi:hypothetical protein
MHGFWILSKALCIFLCGGILCKLTIFVFLSCHLPEWCGCPRNLMLLGVFYLWRGVPSFFVFMVHIFLGLFSLCLCIFYFALLASSSPLPGVRRGFILVDDWKFWWTTENVIMLTSYKYTRSVQNIMNTFLIFSCTLFYPQNILYLFGTLQGVKTIP